MSEPYLPLYVGDYLRDTGYLTLDQHGAYCLLLMRLWSAGGSLPSDEQKLARIAGVTIKRWRPIWADLEAFFVVGEGTISHNRITSELQKAKGLHAKRAAAGAKGGAAKSLKTLDPDLANAKARPKQIIPYHKEEVEKEPKGSQKSKHGSRLPKEFLPDLDWATDAGLTLSQATSEAAQFADYWKSASGANAVKLDWNATWRNWVRNGVKRQGARGLAFPKQSKADKLRAQIERELNEQPLGTEIDRLQDARSLPVFAGVER